MHSWRCLPPLAVSYGAEREGRIEAQMRSQVAAEEAAAAAGSRGGLLARLWGGVEAVAVRVGLRSRRYDGHVRLLEEPGVTAAAAAGGAPLGATAVQVRGRGRGS